MFIERKYFNYNDENYIYNENKKYDNLKNNNIFNYEEKQNIDKINEYRDKKENENISENRHKVLTSIGEE